MSSWFSKKPEIWKCDSCPWSRSVDDANAVREAEEHQATHRGHVIYKRVVEDRTPPPLRWWWVAWILAGAARLAGGGHAPITDVLGMVLLIVAVIWSAAVIIERRQAIAAILGATGGPSVERGLRRVTTIVCFGALIVLLVAVGLDARAAAHFKAQIERERQDAAERCRAGRAGTTNFVEEFLRASPSKQNPAAASTAAATSRPSAATLQACLEAVFPPTKQGSPERWQWRSENLVVVGVLFSVALASLPWANSSTQRMVRRPPTLACHRACRRGSKRLRAASTSRTRTSLATGFPSRVMVISFSRSSIASAFGQRWRRSRTVMVFMAQD